MIPGLEARGSGTCGWRLAACGRSSRLVTLIGIALLLPANALPRSEERRGGKEGRSRWSQYP